MGDITCIKAGLDPRIFYISTCRGALYEFLLSDYPFTDDKIEPKIIKIRETKNQLFDELGNSDETTQILMMNSNKPSRFIKENKLRKILLEKFLEKNKPDFESKENMTNFYKSLEVSLLKFESINN